ncbi:MAG: mechanosensitive ion channel [Chitinivibrionales bacterium]|nr:mechanosensitive ion channel [Chitinivibrionales bacterium]MBD3396574.1 mechanosensitive ion channel [Chitinivibrionales bacterium]
MNDSFLALLRTRLNEFVSVIGDLVTRQNWGLILGVLLAAFALERLALFLFSKISFLTKKTGTDLDDRIVEHTTRPVGNFVLLFGAFLVVNIFAFPDTEVDVKAMLLTIVRVAVVVNALWLMWRLTDVLGAYLFSKVARTSSRLDDQLVPILTKTLKVFIGILAAVYVIQAMGYSVSGIIAGLGIGGLAVAMAAKDTLANFFGSIMILSDRPFGVGDWIKVGDDQGVVEEIGFRSTRIRTFPKTLISVPNSVIANAAIDNHSRMPKRRVKMTIGVTYDSTAEQLERLVSRIKEILLAHESVDHDFLMVKFTDFGAYSLDVLVYYFTVAVDWATHLAVRQEINFSIMRAVEDLGMSFAFPTQTLHMHQDRGPQ